MTYAVNNNNPKAAFDAILQDYERKTKTNRSSVRSKLMMIRLAEYENVTALVNGINELCSLYATLTDHSKDIDDEEKLVALTNALPSSYDSIVELIFNIDNVTFNIAVPKVLDREQKLQASSSSDVAIVKNLTNFANAKNVELVTRFGYPSKSCPNCRHCKRTLAKCKCSQPGDNQRSQTPQAKAQAAIGQSQVQITEQHVSPNAQANESGFNLYGLSCSDNVIVVLDCGCTSILLNNINLFDKSSLRPKTKLFKAADGGSIVAKQKGFAYLNGLMVKAYYIPSLSVNLVGMAKIFKAGYKIEITTDKAIVYGHGVSEVFYCTNNLWKMKVKLNVASFSSCYSSIE
eukprot:Pgem_evm2s136